eukprot:7029005-Pyramimonas_sp.AAC.1
MPPNGRRRAQHCARSANGAAKRSGRLLARASAEASQGLGVSYRSRPCRLEAALRPPEDPLPA